MKTYDNLNRCDTLESISILWNINVIGHSAFCRKYCFKKKKDLLFLKIQKE